MVVGGLGAMQMQMQMQFCMHLRRQHSTMPVKAASILRAGGIFSASAAHILAVL